MNIAQSIKKALATFSAFALMLTSMPVAFAQTFNDVPTNSWFYDFVEQLVDQGVFDVSDSFRPEAALNRAELVKIVITAIDGLVDFEPPATPTFDDVSPNAWYYDYVEAAVQLGIVSGYTDVSGNLTGLFGPSDTVNRAAGTKILVNAFSVPTTLSPGSPFSDVATSAWFHDYVLTAYNQSVLDGYENGNFGPADPVTRAQVAKLVANAQNPVARFGDDEPVVDDDDDDAPVAGEGALEVSLNDNTAPSSTVPLSATSVEVLSVDFTAADDDVNVTNLTITRGGVGDSIDWEAMYVYDGNSRLTTGRSINSDTNRVAFSFNRQVSAGTTRTLRVLGDVAPSETATSNNQHYFYLASASSVQSNAQSVAGDFPVTGNTFSIGAVSTTTVTISTGSTPAQPTVGANDEEISAFQLAAGPENDLALHQLTLTQNGSLEGGKMVNLKLLRGTDVVATADGFDGDLVTFVLDTPFVVDAGQTKSFFVRADLTGGRPADDTIELYLDENTDLVVIDQQYGYGARVTNQFDTAQTPTLTLKGGKVTVTDNGPASTQVAQNSTNVALFDYSITTTRDLTVKDMDLIIRAGIGGDEPNVPDVSPAVATTAITAGTAAATATLTVDAEASLADNDYFILHEAATTPGAATAVCFYIDIDNGAALADDTGTAAACQAANGVAGGVKIDLEAADGGAAADVADVAATVVATAIHTAINGVGAALDVTSVDNADGTLTLTQDTLGTTGNIALNADYLAEAASGTSALTAFTGGTAGNLRTGFRTVADIGDGADVFFVTIGGTTYYCALTNVGVVNTTTTNATTDCPSVSTGAGTQVVTHGVDPYQFIENVRILDIDTGATLQGPVTRWNATTTKVNATTLLEAGNTTDTAYLKVMPEDYDLIAGETRHLRVEVDLNQNMPPGLEIGAEIDFDDGHIKDFEANKDIPASDIVGASDGLTGNLMSVEANSLTVAKTSNVISQDYVKGSKAVNALQFALQAGDAGDITVKKINLRVYGDTLANGFANGGDTEGKNLVSSVSLYDGDQLVAGPESVELVGGSTFTADVASTYSKALFDDLNIVISKGGTKTLTAKVDLQTSITGTFFLALDMEPSVDVTAEDSDADTIAPVAGNLNLQATPDPQISIIQSGTLTANSTSGSISQEVWAGGTDDILVAKYNFTAEKEAFTVNKLTVMNDAGGVFDAAVDTNVLEGITIRYPDVNGNTIAKTGTLTAGSVNFSGLGFRVPKDTNATIEIWADTKAITGGLFTLSGKKFRLGIQGVGNTSGTFDAVGASSSTTVNAPTFTNAANIVQHVVRASKPIFTGVNQATTQMGTNNVELYKFQVTADGGNVVLARLVLDVNTAGLQSAATDDVYNFSFEVNGSQVNSVNIFAVGSTGCGASATVPVKNALSGDGLQDACTTAAGVDNALYKVIVSFDSPEEVIANQTNTYTLKASITGATSNDTIDTSLATGDEDKELSALAITDSNGNGTSGTLSDITGSNVALFDDQTAGGDLCDESAAGAATDDFAKLVGDQDQCNIIWSDRSGGTSSTTAAVSVYPTIASGVVDNGSGTVDFTNGYLLNAQSLNGFSYAKP